MKVADFSGNQDVVAAGFWPAQAGMGALFFDLENGNPIVDDIVMLASVKYPGEPGAELVGIICGVDGFVVAETVYGFVRYVSATDRKNKQEMEKASRELWLAHRKAS